MSIKNFIYDYTLPTDMEKLLDFARQDEASYTELEMATSFNAYLGCDIDRSLTLAYADGKEFPLQDFASTVEESLRNHPYSVAPHTPFEFFVFGHQGGDGLVYGYLILAPELSQEDYPVASFAAIDNSGPWWLGEHTRQAFENLLTVTIRGISEYRPEKLPDFYDDAKYKFLCEAFDLKPDIRNEEIKAGARTNKRVIPTVPDGWHYESDDRGVGVLTQKGKFNFDFDHTNLMAVKQVDLLDIAIQQMKKDYDGTAVLLLNRLYNLSYDAEKITEVCKYIKEAYYKLGKDLLAKSVDVSLEGWIALYWPKK